MSYVEDGRRITGMSRQIVSLCDRITKLEAALAEACDIAEDFILGKFMSTTRTREQGAVRIAELRKDSARAGAK